MNGSFNFNWNDIEKFGKNTFSNYETLGYSLKKIQEITSDISNCWEGVDANTFNNSMNNFITELNADTNYFKYLSEYFTNASNTISGTINDYEEVMTRMGNEIDDNRIHSIR